MADRRIYKVTFVNQGQVYELYAKAVSQGSLFGFIEVEGLLFGERSKMVVDPSEERLKNEFKGVERFHLPMHTVVRIDEVEKEGVSRISEGRKGDGSLTPFPIPVSGPGGEGGGKS